MPSEGIGQWWLYNFLTPDDDCFTAWISFAHGRTTGSASSSTVKDCSSAPSYVCDRCRLQSLYAIDLTWSRDSEHSCHLSAVDGNPLPGSARVPWTTTDGNSFSSMCFVFKTD